MSPPRTILSARLAALAKHQELEHKNLAECSSQEVSLHRPEPRAISGLGRMLPAVPAEVPGGGGEKRLRVPSECVCSLESITGSISGFSSLGERSVAVETPPNAPDAFSRGGDLICCHAPKRVRTLAKRTMSNDDDQRFIAF